MARKYPQLTLLFVVAACGNERAAAAKPVVIEVKDATGALALTLSVTPAQCAVTGEAELTVAREGEAAVATMGATKLLTLGPGRTGVEVFDPDGTARLRVIDQPGRLDLISKEGVPVAKIAATEASATVANAARTRVLEVTRDGDRLVATPTDDSPPHTITGTDDLTLAAVLAVPGVPPDVRALLACARALPQPAPGSHSP